PPTQGRTARPAVGLTCSGTGPRYPEHRPLHQTASGDAMNGVAKRVSQLSLVLALVLAAGACKKVGESAADAAIERATGVKVDRDGDQVTLHSKDGDLAIRTGESVALPDDFPDDIYLPA